MYTFQNSLKMGYCYQNFDCELSLSEQSTEEGTNNNMRKITPYQEIGSDHNYAHSSCNTAIKGVPLHKISIKKHIRITHFGIRFMYNKRIPLCFDLQQITTLKPQELIVQERVKEIVSKCDEYLLLLIIQDILLNHDHLQITCDKKRNHMIHHVLQEENSSSIFIYFTETHNHQVVEIIYYYYKFGTTHNKKSPLIIQTHAKNFEINLNFPFFQNMWSKIFLK
ncbi:hypothetical protein ACJX0J_012952 [Zea mays]